MGGKIISLMYVLYGYEHVPVCPQNISKTLHACTCMSWPRNNLRHCTRTGCVEISVTKHGTFLVRHQQFEHEMTCLRNWTVTVYSVSTSCHLAERVKQHLDQKHQAQDLLYPLIEIVLSSYISRSPSHHAY